MKYLFRIIILSFVLFGCKKHRTNPDDLITYKKYFRLDKITCDTIFTFYIPSGFTPNSDGLNEFWEPKSNYLDSSNYHIDIFNKGGKIIFKSDVPAKFDGKRKIGGTYPEQTFGYSIEAADQSGNKYSFKGQFTLLE